MADEVLPLPGGPRRPNRPSPDEPAADPLGRLVAAITNDPDLDERVRAWLRNLEAGDAANGSLMCPPHVSLLGRS